MPKSSRIAQERVDLERRLAVLPAHGNAPQRDNAQDIAGQVAKVLQAVETVLTAEDVLSGPERNMLYASILQEVRREGERFVMRLRRDETVKGVSTC